MPRRTPNPLPPTTAVRLDVVDDPHAIAVIAGSGLAYEVGPLGTTVEGDPDVVWSTLRRAHEATLAHGATSAVTVIKVLEAGDGTATMRELTDPHRTRRD